MLDDTAYNGQPFVTNGADGSMNTAYQGQPFVTNNGIIASAKSLLKMILFYFK